MPNPKPNPQLNSGSKFLKYTSLAFQMAATIAVFTFGGLWLDKQMAWKIPVFTLLLSLFGVLGSLFYVIRRL